MQLLDLWRVVHVIVKACSAEACRVSMIHVTFDCACEGLHFLILLYTLDLSHFDYSLFALRKCCLWTMVHGRPYGVRLECAQCVQNVLYFTYILCTRSHSQSRTRDTRRIIINRTYQSPYQTADVTSHTVDTAAHDAHAAVL